MIPSFFVYLDQVPLTANGKIDHKSLPAPDLTLRILGDEYIAPRNKLESQICQIWAELLGLAVDKVGIQDDFFRLGGNSLLAIKLISKINKELNSSISVVSIFKHNTVEKLVKYLELEILNSEVTYRKELKF